MAKNEQAGHRKVIGIQGEEIAATYLQNHGFTILNRNWRAGRSEVDIIAAKDNVLHFVEVKCRSGNGGMLPEYNVTAGKMAALKRAAEVFLIQNPEWKHIQFDVVSISLGSETDICYIADVN